jgi:Holliday junction resolvasome RuvABC endonuclease subunit
MTKKIVLGLDCSSTTIGFAALIVDGYTIEFVKMGYIKPPKKGHIVERIAQTRDQVQKLIEEVKPDHIAVEEIISYMAGKSTAKTIIMLATFNRMICLLAHDYLGKVPTLHNVMSIRHGIKLSKELPAKEAIPMLVAQRLGIEFPWEYKKNGKPKDECGDKADGTAVALYHAMLLTGQKKAPKTKKVK